MKYLDLVKFAIWLVLWTLHSFSLYAQCMSYPVSLEERVLQSQRIVLGEVVQKVAYKENHSGNIYTANTLRVTAWMKGHGGDHEVVIITPGGTLDNEALIVHPSLQLDLEMEYILFLEEDNFDIDNKSLRQTKPWLMQAEAYAAAQGAIIKQFDLYRDVYSEPVRDEKGIFNRITQLTGAEVLTPEGLPFEARPYTGDGVVPRSVNITTFGPNPTNAGTIDASEFLTINGSNFGSTDGSVLYRNADDGGNTYISSGIESDNVSWSNTQVVNKVAIRAGTGTFKVRRSDNVEFTSGSVLNILYSHMNINSDFLSFPTSTRQRFYLRNVDGQGGYTFLYNTDFHSNTPAVQSFERALDTWRCNTTVNFIMGGTTSINTSANDGVSVVFFNSLLPAGVLGQASTRFSSSGNSSCNLHNTVWYLTEVDLAFRPNPTTTHTWNFGPGSTASNQYDFETVALHELGHAHGLGHVINNLAVMHYALSNGTDKRVLSGSEEAGGNAKMEYSTQPTCLNPGGTSPMEPYLLSSCGFLSVDLLEFTGTRIDDQTNQLVWSGIEDLNSDYYRIQRSEDGKQFTDHGYINAVASEKIETYEWIDHTAGSQPWYYRLAHTDQESNTTHFNTIFIGGSGHEPDLKVRFTGNGQFLISGLNNETGNYQLTLMTTDGKLLYYGTVNHQQPEIVINNIPNSILIYKITNGRSLFTGKVIAID